MVARQDVFYDDDVGGGMEDQSLRGYSEIIFLRAFNNWIKSLQINKYSEMLIPRPMPSVFDLCAGKGGDIHKWLRQKPSHYVALEYQQALIDKAVERLK